jgi:hypothetical protein
MDPLSTLLQRASDRGVPPSMEVKSALGREVVRSLASLDGLVLQGGGALHHIYGSPRFSADIGLAQTAMVAARDLARDFERDFEAACEAVRQLVEREWGSCELGSVLSKGRLHRNKLRFRWRRGATLVLAIERYETPVHRRQRRPLFLEPDSALRVWVEAPEELIADKIAASIDRIRTRGTLKLRDVYDLDFLRHLSPPEPELVRLKLADYGLPPDLDLLESAADSLDALAAAELVEQLRDVLPQVDLEAFDAKAALEAVRALFLEVLRG